jgi:Raf kinase inhibitor-like YbhB/YbcL family protein
MKTLLLIIMATLIYKPLTVKSPAFGSNEMIPSKYTCTGSDINPALSIAGIPDGTKSLALVVDDPDAPNGTFDHWVMWNVPVTANIGENTAPGIQGKNGKGNNTYMGPCPPSGTHHYHFRVYALDTQLDLPATAGKKELLKAIEGHTLASGELVGLYKK